VSVKTTIIKTTGLLASVFIFNLSHAEQPFHFESNELRDMEEYISKSSGYSKVVKAKHNVILKNGNKISTDNIQYIKAKAYDHEGHDWSTTDDYRVISKSVDTESAYAISVVNSDYLGILHLTRYNKAEQLNTHVIPKGTIQISPYFLHCNKEKNKKVENSYYSYSYDEVNDKLMQMKEGEYGDSFYKNEFDLICKHTYVDRTNGIVDIE
jgi:hypothetical protein